MSILNAWSRRGKWNHHEDAWNGGALCPSQFQGPGREPGDLLLEIDVEPSRLFRREGQDIVVSRDIDFTDAILGTPLR